MIASDTERPKLRNMCNDNRRTKVANVSINTEDSDNAIEEQKNETNKCKSVKPR